MAGVFPTPHWFEQLMLRVRCFRARRYFLALAFTMGLLSTASATSVVPPTFAELVSASQIIVRAKVKSVRCAWVDSPQGRVIKTYVTLDVLKRLKGESPVELTLQLLGGEINGEEMRIPGMPEFTVGKTQIIFVAGNGVRFCPVVAMMHGRYHLMQDATTAREYVARDDGVPLESEHDVQLPQAANGVANRFKRASAALSPNDFEVKITEEVARHAARL